MNAQGPVLRDIHLPPAAWWPPAPGWWLLAGALVVIAAGIAWWLWRHARRRPLRAALREIDVIESAFAHDGDVERLVEDASRLLRRVACRIDRTAASRSGVAWQTFLRRHARDAATRQALEQLSDMRFRANPTLPAPAPVLLPALRVWCRDALRGRTTTHAGTPKAMKQAAPA